MRIKKSEMIDIVDFHSHILPRADHGSSSVDESLAQLKLASSVGIRRIIATPHFYPDSDDVNVFIERRHAAYERLLSALTPELPSVILGAEVLICAGIENMPGLDRLFISNTKTLLLELSYADFDYSHVKTVASLVASGIDVVLAHADRYPAENVYRMLEVGARIQLNADSLKCMFLPKHVKEWLSADKVIAIGSDIHGTDQRAYRCFESAVSKLSKYIDHIKLESDKIWHKAAGN